MRIILDTTIDNDELPMLNQYSALMSDTLIAGYGMLNNRDFSGNGNHFSWNGAFNAYGAILADDTDHIMTTPVMEQDEMTVIICCYLDAGAVAASLLNNLNVASAPYDGTRLSRITTQNVVQMDVASATSGVTSLQLTLAGAWTVRTLSWNGSTLRVINHAGVVTPVTLPSRRKGVTYPYAINGVPSGRSSGSFTAGTTGTIGMMAFYNEFMDAAKAVSYMDAIDDIMLTRGAVIP